MIDCLLVPAEEETGERLRMLLHLANGRVHVLVGEDWQKRPKDLVLHDRIVPCHRINDRRIEIAGLRVGRPTSDDLLLIDETSQALSSFWADDARVVVGPALWISPIQFHDSFLAFLNKLFCNCFVHIGVSGRCTPLTAPSRRAQGDLLGCIRDICGRVNESRILATEFEENGSQILCGRLHNDLANLHASGEEDEVEGQLEKLRHLVFAAGDGSDGPRIEILWNEIEQDVTGGGQTLGEFEDAWITSRNNLDSGVEEQRQWSIEWPDNQGDAVRFPIDFSSMPALPKGLGHNHIYGLHPLFQILLREGDGSYRRHNLEDFLLAGRLEVAAHRSLKNLGVLIAQVLKACQLVDAPLVRLSRIRIEICFLPVEDFLKLIHMNLPRTSVCRCRFQQRCELLGHCEDYAESRFTRHHAPIRFFGLIQMKRFDHGTNAREDAEIKSVLCLDRSSRQASNDRAATKDERNAVDRNRITRNTNHHELSSNGEAGKQAGDCCSAGGGCQDHVGASQFLQRGSCILSFGVDVNVSSKLGSEMFFVRTEADCNGAKAHLLGVLHAKMS